MKAIASAIIAFVLTLGANAQLTTNQPAQWKSKVECFAKGRQTGMVSSSIDVSPETTFTGNGGTDTCTSPGVEHTLKWTFIGRNQNRDVYQFTFTRLTRAGSSRQITDSREIQFDGKRIVVFDDELHKVVMEAPEPEDLKSAAQRQ